MKEYVDLGFDDAKIYNDFVIKLEMTKGLNVIRRSDGSYYISQKKLNVEVKTLEKLAFFKTVKSQIKKYGGRCDEEGIAEYRRHVKQENFVDEYINEIGYEIGVEVFDRFGRNLRDGLKRHYSKEELENEIDRLIEEKEKLKEVNPFNF